MAALSVPVKRLDASIELPAYAHVGDSGMDVRSTVDISLKPFERLLVPCGFSLAIPAGYGGFVLPRSGLAAKRGVTVANAPGLIDSNYRGEVMVALVNLDPKETFTARRGERIAQLVLLPTPEFALQEQDNLEETQRGSGGFGSSGTL
ncbi:MAG: dUTP diphosphatase [Coriobacteriia bacterium]|nr:dUTP diphosphatase [Coriobacteriia bacterium]